MNKEKRIDSTFIFNNINTLREKNGFTKKLFAKEICKFIETQYDTLQYQFRPRNEEAVYGLLRQIEEFASFKRSKEEKLPNLDTSIIVAIKNIFSITYDELFEVDQSKEDLSIVPFELSDDENAFFTDNVFKSKLCEAYFKLKNVAWDSKYQSIIYTVPNNYIGFKIPRDSNKLEKNIGPREVIRRERFIGRPLMSMYFVNNKPDQFKILFHLQDQSKKPSKGKLISEEERIFLRDIPTQQFAGQRHFYLILKTNGQEYYFTDKNDELYKPFDSNIITRIFEIIIRINS